MQAASWGCIKPVSVKARDVQRMVFPLLVALRPRGAEAAPTLGIVTAAKDGQLILFRAGTNSPQALDAEALEAEFAPAGGKGKSWLSAPTAEAVTDPDAQANAAGVSRVFGFGWFVPELLKHRQVWRDVLLASLALQLIALATPLFTQAIIDKVVVHRTQSTLIAIGIAMLLFTGFSGVMSWVRQYLVLHTGNRVDAVLGAAVWAHLLKLPLRYFERRSTGVVSARLHGIETIREFVSGAAVSLLLDLPFLVICLGVMLWYSVLLTAIALGMLAIITLVSVIIAPMFQAQLNQQFMMSARNQAFVTEHIAGFETVKSLQMEPLLRQRYNGYLAALLAAGFRTRQLGNSYNTFATTMDQLQTLAILVVGAWTVMHEPSFTIGMLVAFQMFSAKLSQPVLRIVGLWSQFQHASLAVQRLGDVMNAPAEPYTLTPQRPANGAGRIEVQGLGFRYADDRPLLYENLNLTLEPGQAIALMGPSGSGKSTLAKLMLGFYTPTAGSIRIDGVDTRHLSANELRAHFGVVPQETILFSGSVLANLMAGNPAASFEQVVQACKLAGIHATVEALPQGYQTEVGERGAGLSGGQKQRLAIARALLKAPKVLIFDEATSALDSATAEAFAKTVNSLKGRVTMLFISHALPRGLRVDEVISLGPSLGAGGDTAKVRARSMQDASTTHREPDIRPGSEPR
ncbi:MAG: peptidase domain-containing ABC transporter [Ideonella sp.]|nr:peptidase domain-containing ABC transporter [Ideonella sp.]